MADTQTRPSPIKQAYETWAAVLFNDTTATAITPPTLMQWYPNNGNGYYATAATSALAGSPTGTNRIASINRIGALSAVSSGAVKGLYAVQLQKATARVLNVAASFQAPLTIVGTVAHVAAAAPDVQLLTIPAFAITNAGAPWALTNATTGLTFTINGITYSVTYTTFGTETAAKLVTDILALNAPGLTATAGGSSTTVNISMTQTTVIGGTDLATLGLTAGTYTPQCQDGPVGPVPLWSDTRINATPATTLVFQGQIIGVPTGAAINYWMATQTSAAVTGATIPTTLSAALPQMPVVTSFTPPTTQVTTQPAAVTDGSVTWTWVATVPNNGGSTQTNQLILIGFSKNGTFADPLNGEIGLISFDLDDSSTT